jgi:hypothetical protein
VITLCKRDKTYKEAAYLLQQLEFQARKEKAGRIKSQVSPKSKLKLKKKHESLLLIRAKVILGRIGKVQRPSYHDSGTWYMDRSSREGRRVGIGTRSITELVETGFAFIDDIFCIATEDCRKFSESYIQKNPKTIQKDFNLTTSALEMLGLRHLSSYEPLPLTTCYALGRSDD